MNLKTYQAYTMAEALAAVKRDLGSDAVILNTRTFKRRSMLGLLRQTIVEVTATPSEETRPRRTGASLTIPSASAATSRRVALNHIAAQQAYGAKLASVSDGAAKGAANIEPVSADDRERTRRLALAMHARFESERRASTGNGTDSLQRPVDAAKADPPPVTQAQGRLTENESDNIPPQRFVLVPPNEESQSKPQAVSSAVDAELAAIKSMVNQVLQQQANSNGKAPPTLPPKLNEYYLSLIGQDISEELASQIVNEVRDRLSGPDLEDETRVRAAVADQLAGLIPASNEPLITSSPDGRPLTIALVGPTGVGKTTTLAKLAATFKLKHNKRVGLITSDTYRIAAVDQLRTYANIIGLPLQVALTPAEMRQAVHQLSHCEVILIDTAGRSQNDVLRIDELRQFLDAGRPHEVHLVLSSTASEKVLRREAEAFSKVGVQKVVLTKLDEAVSFGMLVNVMRSIGKQLSFITTGQEVPHHIEPGQPHRLAELILGGTLHE